MSAAVAPAQGAVIGIDVGFSATRASSAICRLDWDRTSIRWDVRRFRAVEPERGETIAAVAGGRPIITAAFDGPLRGSLDVIDRYRTAERLLTRGLGRLIGKPGTSNVPLGRQLNAAASSLVRQVLTCADVGAARHRVAIHPQAIVEAFPNAFLGLMIADPSRIAVERNNRSDKYYEHLTATGDLAKLLNHCLPGRTEQPDFTAITDHDDRAAVVCALAALCIAADTYSAVGDTDGWIILPPRQFIQPAQLALLTANAQGELAAGLHFQS